MEEEGLVNEVAADQGLEGERIEEETKNIM